MPNLTLLKIKPISPQFKPEYFPCYQTAGAAGIDLCACIAHPVVLPPGKRCLVGAGFSLEVPQGYEVQVRPRSGLAIKHGITLLNTPGTIDSDYRGEVKVILINLGEEDFVISPGDRIAQMVVAPVVQASIESTETLSATDRDSGGFGHTGK
jgi:dUTP pyrophosphatase